MLWHGQKSAYGSMLAFVTSLHISSFGTGTNVMAVIARPATSCHFSGPSAKFRISARPNAHGHLSWSGSFFVTSPSQQPAVAGLGQTFSTMTRPSASKCWQGTLHHPAHLRANRALPVIACCRFPTSPRRRPGLLHYLALILHSQRSGPRPPDQTIPDHPAPHVFPAAPA